MPRIAPVLALGVFLVFAPQVGSTPQAPSASTTSEPTTPEAIKQFNDEKAAEVLQQIAGKEEQPSETVYKNIQMFKGMPAGRLVRIMQLGFSNSLGVSCAHCHVTGAWEKEDKPQKQIAREMSKMSATINNDLLKNISGLKGPNPIVNCTTCHRGEVKPALNLPAPATK